MPLVADFLYHPRRLRLRRAAFQVHLWAGLALVLYLLAISLSGTILIFKNELTRLALPPAMHPWQTDRTASTEAVLLAFHAANPGASLNSLQFPSSVLPAWVLEGRTVDGKTARWLADPQTARIQTAPRTWLDWTHDLHYYLLLPSSWGMQANAAGAAGLLLLAVTGIVLWWPGTRLWQRGLRVNVRAGWRRIHYDLHNAVGFWTLAIVLWWAISGVYFGFYRQFTAAVSVVSPIQGMTPPAPRQLRPPSGSAHASLEQILTAARQAAPGARLWSVGDPDLRGQDLYVSLDRAAAGDFSHRDIVHVRAADAAIMSVWHYGRRHTLGDWILWSMHPLHFGTVWGPGIKILWAVLGLSLASLTVTGTVMYWNRFLRHHWR